MTEVSSTPTPAKPRRSIAVRLLLVLGAGLLAIAGYIEMQPADFQIIRTTTINAPASAVFPHVNGLHQWEEWSPWAKLDPNVKNSFSGPESGKDAVFAWNGNDKVGEGKMTILESHPDELVKINLQFIRPFPDTCLVDFTFKPEGDKTVVTWRMAGHKAFVNKAVCMFMDMDKMVGGDFEKGLASMKAVVEKEAR